MQNMYVMENIHLLQYKIKQDILNVQRVLFINSAL